LKPFDLDGHGNESEDEAAAEQQQGNLRVAHLLLRRCKDPGVLDRPVSNLSLTDGRGRASSIGPVPPQLLSDAILIGYMIRDTIGEEEG
jgi:hypothetical protein